MAQDYSRVHYKKCRYPSCNITSRDGIPGLTFHAFPVRHADRCIRWLVNCGLDDWVEMSEKELKLRYICSRHFSDDSFYATGRLKPEAVPIILGLENLDHIKHGKKGNKSRRVVSTELDLLKKQIEKLETKLEKERQKKAEIRAKLCSTRVALSRLKTKLTEGTFDDMCLNKALANRIDGFVLTFIRMQLFHRQSTCYTSDEQRLCMMMHCVSPALYAKMRDDFKFVLPNEITMIRWFNKINISPKKANLVRVCKSEEDKESLEDDLKRTLMALRDERLAEEQEELRNEHELDDVQMQNYEEEQIQGSEDEQESDEEHVQELTVEQIQEFTERQEREFADEDVQRFEEGMQEFIEQTEELVDGENQDGDPDVNNQEESQLVLSVGKESNEFEFITVACYDGEAVDGGFTTVSYFGEKEGSQDLTSTLSLSEEVEGEGFDAVESIEEETENVKSNIPPSYSMEEGQEYIIV